MRRSTRRGWRRAAPGTFTNDAIAIVCEPQRRDALQNLDALSRNISGVDAAQASSAPIDTRIETTDIALTTGWPACATCARIGSLSVRDVSALPAVRRSARVNSVNRQRVAAWRRVGRRLACRLPRRAARGTDVHRNIEIILGRLLTDEGFRRAFNRDLRGTLERAAWRGLALTAGEVRAILATDQSLWERAAGELDSRLKKAA